MSFYNIKKIQISSIVKVFPIIFTISGTILGAILFLSNSLARNLDFNLRLLLLSSLSFSLIYIVFMTLSGIVVVCVYNFVAGKLSCNIVISLESKTSESDDSVDNDDNK
ncbi:MAG: hypothetical protein Nk1A_3200 [Endomicrobiia bacterium]|nr:MAG: hypothetical protein Nk1A_3200 [Endomicrobiia bacterium]